MECDRHAIPTVFFYGSQTQTTFSMQSAPVESPGLGDCLIEETRFGTEMAFDATYHCITFLGLIKVWAEITAWGTCLNFWKRIIPSILEMMIVFLATNFTLTAATCFPIYSFNNAFCRIQHFIGLTLTRTFMKIFCTGLSTVYNVIAT
jgi:hypothetical protein